ncbi:hypothetical protein B4U80_05973 [Leptotrombidium deliense]|uniref:Uncharacterized protein n=1 Tax=Leptotrombidium deliense TaxID=299467 RepID=A0A443SA30_9ACAR|nr:hypothetical protein B4U80_05973 [Leptotrombidium deliense]
MVLEAPVAETWTRCTRITAVEWTAQLLYRNVETF